MNQKANSALLLQCIDEERLKALIQEATEQAVKKAIKEMGYIHPDSYISKEEAAKMIGLNTNKKSWQVMMSRYQNIKYHDPALPSYRNLGAGLRFKVRDVIEFMERRRHQSGI
jgi:hypothetical protein